VKQAEAVLLSRKSSSRSRYCQVTSNAEQPAEHKLTCFRRVPNDAACYCGAGTWVLDLRGGWKARYSRCSHIYLP